MSQDSTSSNGPAANSGTGGTPVRQFVAPSTDTTLSEALITLRKRRLVLALFVLAALAYGFYKAVTQIRLYEAFGRIEVRAGGSDEFKLSSASFFGDDPQRKLSTEEAIIESDTLMATVARDLNLANNPKFFGVKSLPRHQSLDDPGVRQAIVGTLQSNLKVGIVPKTDIMRISYSSLDPNLSADVVNKVILDYIARSYQTRFASTQQVSQYLASQLDDLKQKVESSQQQMMDLQKKLGTLGFDSTHNQISASLDDLAKASAQAKLARILAESRFRLLSQMDPNSIVSSMDSLPGAAEPELTTLRTALANAQAQYAQLKTYAGPELR